MKNTIKSLNQIFAYTDVNLIKQNIVLVLLLNSEKLIKVILTSSQLKIFKKYWNNKLIERLNKEKLNIPSRDVILEDIKNFRRYYKEFSFIFEFDRVKEMFINNNISMENLISYIDSADYLWLKSLDIETLNSGILVEKNKYNNILIDLKLENIPKEIIYDYPISLLFKFGLSKSKYLLDLSEENRLKSIEKLSILFQELEDKGYISSYDEKIKSKNIDEDIDLDDVNLDQEGNLILWNVHNGYCGNHETYDTFKDLLILYLDGITLYKYQGKHYTFY